MSTCYDKRIFNIAEEEYFLITNRYPMDELEYTKYLFHQHTPVIFIYEINHDLLIIPCNFIIVIVMFG